MTVSVKFHQVPQTVTVDLSHLPSNRSCLTRRKIVIGVIGGVLGIGITAAVTAYFFNKTPIESAFPTGTSEYFSGSTGTSTEYSVDPTESLISESIQSLHNIVKLVTTDSNGYENCTPAFQAHWERFKECGPSMYACMQNSIKLFGKLYCNPPTNSFGYIDDHSEKCENNYFALARCDI